MNNFLYWYIYVLLCIIMVYKLRNHSKQGLYSTLVSTIIDLVSIIFNIDILTFYFI